MKSIAVLGAGPAGSVLAALLAEQGHTVVVFDDERRPDLIVGESLVPALVPILRRLGMEERVAEIGVYKPGVKFVLSPDRQVVFDFRSATHCGLPPYSYNVPRPAFDQLLAARGAEAGAIFVRRQATVEKSGPETLKLARETLAAAPALQGRQPDLIVDATGRRRLLARTLEIPSRVGKRKDVAYFAHFEGCDPGVPRGQVTIARMAEGWSWQIPLRDRLSVGIVLNKEAAARLGSNPEERLETALRHDPSLEAVGKKARRISEVAAYSNYQLVSERGSGPGWVAVGDAFGFVDPMLSPGMWLALHSAEYLADHLDDLPAYEKEMTGLIEAWMELIDYYYDGRIFSMYFTGTELERRLGKGATRIFRNYTESKIAGMASGGTTESRYNLGFLRFMARFFTWAEPPSEFVIR